MNQKRFINILIVLAVIIVVAGAGYFIWLQKFASSNRISFTPTPSSQVSTQTPVVQPTNQSSTTQVAEMPSAPLTIPANKAFQFVEGAILLMGSKNIIALDPINNFNFQKIYEIVNGSLYDIQWSQDRKNFAYIQSVFSGNNDRPCTLLTCAFALMLLNKQHLTPVVIALMPTKDLSSSPFYAWLGSSAIIYYTGSELRRYDINTGNSSLIAKLHISGSNNASGRVAFQIVNDSLYFSDGGTLKKLDIRNPSQVEIVYETGKNGMECGIVSPNGKIFICESVPPGDGSAFVFNSETNSIKKFGEYPCDGFLFYGFTSDSRYFSLGSGCGEGGITELFNSSGKSVNNNALSDAALLTFSPDGGKIFFVSSMANPDFFLSNIDGSSVVKINVDKAIKKDIDENKQGIYFIVW